MIDSSKERNCKFLVNKTPIHSTLEHRKRICCVRRPRLRDIPMLHNTRPIHPIYIGQRNRLWALIDSHMDQPNIAIEGLPQHIETRIRNNARELRSIGVPSLLVKGVVLDEVDSDIGVKGFCGVLLRVENLDEFEEDFFLVFGGGVAGGAVRFCAPGLEERGRGLTELVHWE